MDQRLIDQQEEVTELLEARARQIEDYPLLGFVPNPKQLDFITHDSVKRKLAAGSNQFGKTTIVVTESFCHSIGCRPYLPPDHPNFRVLMPNGEPIPVPNRGQMCGQDFPVGFAENIWPTWKEWIPPSQYYLDKDAWDVTKHERGTPRIIEVDVADFPWADPRRGPSLIFAHAYEQGREAFQGIRCEWVMDDEPPRRPIYIEQTRGLMKTGGKWMGAMTIVEDEQDWIYDLFIPPRQRRAVQNEDLDAVQRELGGAFRSESFYMVVGTVFDNLKSADGSGGLDEENIEDYKEDLEAAGADPSEIAARIYGKRKRLQGTEFGGLWDEEIHVLKKHRDPDPGSCFVVCCDAHPTKPYALVWFEVDAHDCWYAFAESYDETLDDLDLIVDEIHQVERWRPTNRTFVGELTGQRRDAFDPEAAPFLPQIRLIDPLATTKEKARGTGLSTSAIEYFIIEHGIIWSTWSRGDKASRTRLVKSMLKPGKGPIGRPRLTFSPRCDYTIMQMPRYREKKPKDPDRDPRKGEFYDIDADLVQCVIAAASSGLTYDALLGMKPHRLRTLHTKAPGRSVAGYHGHEAEETEPWEEELEDPWRQQRTRRETPLG